MRYLQKKMAIHATLADRKSLSEAKRQFHERTAIELAMHLLPYFVGKKAPVRSDGQDAVVSVQIILD
jgi:hypothetical protein